MRFLRQGVSAFKRLMSFLLEATRELCMRILLTICVFCAYVICSMMVYAVMRQFLVPQKTHILPVHLMFSSSCKNDPVQHYPAVTDSFVRPLDYPSPHHNQRCVYPYAEFYLADGQRLLSPGHVYTVSVELELPESQANSDIGMFMVNLTLYSYSGTPTITSLRPSILHYKSYLLKTFSTIFYSLPLILGLMEERQVQTVAMLEDYTEPYTEGTVFARVTVMSTDIQLYSASLTIDAVFTGLSYYLYHWPISMAVIIVSGIFFSLSSVTLLIWLRRFLERMERFRQRRRHSSLRMNIRASELEPIPEEDEQNRGRHAVHNPLLVENLSTTTDTLETGSTISSVTEVTNSTITDDISELDHGLQNLREQLTIAEVHVSATDTVTGTATGTDTQDEDINLLTAAEDIDKEDDNDGSAGSLRQRRT